MVSVGFSTGAIALGDFARALRIIDDTKADAVELSALRSAELPSLLAALPRQLDSLRRRYRYVSIHAPTDFIDEDDIIEKLSTAAKMNLNIVVHPDTIRDISVWRKLGSLVCLENMDSRRKTGRTAKELRPFFPACLRQDYALTLLTQDRWTRLCRLR